MYLSMRQWQPSALPSSHAKHLPATLMVPRNTFWETLPYSNADSKNQAEETAPQLELKLSQSLSPLPCNTREPAVQ